MKIHSSISFTILTLFVFIIVGTTSAQNLRCPFEYMYIMGDGGTDLGIGIRVPPFGPRLPAARYPYGITNPGRPTGRWSDGLNDADYTARGLGLPNITQFTTENIFTGSNDGISFSVAGSSILENSFFTSRGITISLPSISLSFQVNWYRSYVNPLICTNERECRIRQPANSIIFFKHFELNDVRFPLVQGRSIQEVATYIPLIVQAQVESARVVIKYSGATRIAYTNASPLECSPDILTALSTNDPTAYDEQGCLRAVKNLIVSYNTALRTAFNALKAEFPLATILDFDIYNATRAYINQKSVRGPSGNPALRSCCGIGGRYNFDSERFCGSPNVPVCSNPNDYVYWDGVHLTQEANRRIVNVYLLPRALQRLNCTST